MSETYTMDVDRGDLSGLAVVNHRPRTAGCETMAQRQHHVATPTQEAQA